VLTETAKLPYERFVGVDGCRAGWIAVAQTPDGRLSYEVLPAFASVLEQYTDALILVDVPIGLMDSGPDERLCDREARRLLKDRASSVFPAPVRAALYAANYMAASAANRQATQGRRGLTRQSWAITPKIREVNECLAGRQGQPPVVREMHPEVCFCALNGWRPLRYSKKTTEGFGERAALLCRLLPSSDALVEMVLRATRRSAVRRDDIVDALVGSVTAWLGKGSLSTLPAVPEHDSAGLPMEMVCVAAAPV
jgi:predicted RNase H-like nuclease